MSSSNPATPPSEELRELVTQAVAIEYLRYQDSTVEKDTPAAPKAAWLMLFESVGFAAMVTVVLGSIGGAIITYELQKYAQQREQNVADIRLDHDRKLSTYNQHLDRERSVVDEMFQKLGSFVDASRDLTTLSRKEFCEDCGHQGVSKHLVREKQSVSDKYDNAMINWNSNRLRLGMLLQLEHNNDEALLKEWKELCDAAELYAECADRWRTKHNDLEFHEMLQACVPVRSQLDLTLQIFTRRIVSLRNSSAASTPVNRPQ
jgi:hypothetical protein